MSPRFGAFARHYGLLRRAVNQEGGRIERLPYQQFLSHYQSPVTEWSWRAVVEGAPLDFALQISDKNGAGDLLVEIEVSGLPTWFGVTPGYHFWKRPDGSISY